MPPKKKALAVVKIQLEAGSATPAPPVGTALGPHGVQTIEFCKQYNQATESMRGQVVPVDITIYEDRSFSFVLKTSPTPVLLRQAAGLDKGAATAGPQGGRDDHRRPASRDRHHEVEGPEHGQPRCGQEASGRHGAVHGDQGRGLAAREERHDPARQEVPAHQGRLKSMHGVAEAVDLVKSVASAKFDETIELAVRLGVDPRKADQIVRGTLSLPWAREARSGSPSSPPARPPPTPGLPVPTRSAPTTWWPRSTAASSTSTSPSPRPT